MKYLSLIFAYLTICIPAFTQTMTLQSPGFMDQSFMPIQYTCKGANDSPELSWVNIPDGTKSFAIILKDLSTSRGEMTHWIIYNIPLATNHLPEGLPRNEKLDDTSLQGINDFKKIGYDGPCPPAREKHKYVFTLYALSSMLKLKAGSNLKALQSAMDGKILGQATLTATYQAAP